MDNAIGSLVVLLTAQKAIKAWKNLPGTIDICAEYASVRLSQFQDYCPDKRDWVLVKRDNGSEDYPYELRCVIDRETGYYIVTLVHKDQIGYILNAFGPNYGDKVVSRSVIGVHGKDML